MAAILLEGTPKDLDVAALRRAIEALPGVGGAHDLHAWTLTSGMNAISLHVVMLDGASHEDVLQTVRARISQGFGIAHVTVQVEPTGMADCEAHL